MAPLPALAVARFKYLITAESALARSLQPRDCMRTTSALLLLLSACAVDSLGSRDERGHGGGGKADGFNDLPGAQFDAMWTIQKLDGTKASCPDGYDTIALYSQPLGANGEAVGSPVVDL